MKWLVFVSIVALNGCAMFAQPPSPQLKPPAGREALMGQDYAACQIVADQSASGALLLDKMQRPSVVRNCLISKGYTVVSQSQAQEQ